MSEIDRALCRKYAEDCVTLARMTADPNTKQLLLTRAQEWLKLAYSEGDAELERALSAFNKEQMVLGTEVPPIQPRPGQRQPIQQQQSKIEPDNNGDQTL
jgi:hypothetical protein